MKTLVWDVDDVLNDLMREWFETWWLPRNTSCNVVYAQIRENPPHSILGIPLQTYLDSLDAFRLERGASLKPNPVALAWFQSHGHRFRHMALTTVPLAFADISASWVMKHFGNWIRSFNVVPSPRANRRDTEYDANKADFLEWLGNPGTMIDDKPATITEIASRSAPALLWPQPWNGQTLTPAQALATLESVNKTA